jgi:membrane fusion protein, multidrug efflux system
VGTTMTMREGAAPTLGAEGAEAKGVGAEAAGGGAGAAGAPKRRAKAPLVLGALVVGLATAGGAAYVSGLGRESTDDAFVEAHVASVAARVPGQVVRVLVKDNQHVEVGEVLVELDDRDAKVRLATAEADLLSAQASLAAADTQLALTEKTVDANLRQARGGLTQAAAAESGSRASVDQVRADIDVAGSRHSLAKLDFERTERLWRENAISQAELDAKKAQLEQAEAALAQARSRETGARTNVSGSAGSVEAARGRLVAAEAGPEQVGVARATVGVARARVAQSEAAVEQAKLNLSYTIVRAPLAGVVSRRSVEVGQAVDPARPLLAVTALDDVWVVANFKEVQIAEMREGQAAGVKIDAFPGRPLRGHVESLAGGSGARFSLLPPDNASGNFTKVVQRIPVLVRLDERPPGLALRPGMSSYVRVETR